MKSRRQSGRGAAMVTDGNHNMSSSGGCISKMERKDVEKNRRMHMKGLCQKLSSLLPASSESDHHLRHYSTSSSPPSSSKDAATQLDQLDSAAAYIKQLRARIDDLKRRKQAALSGNPAGCTSSSVSAGDYKGQTAALPVIEVRCQDGTLDVALATEAGRPFQLHEVIAVLEQEGADVVSASFSAVSDKIFYTLHSQALCPRIGLIAQRIRGLAAAAATVSSSVLLT